MWKFCNDDVKYVRKGGRKAPKISLDEFKNKLINYALSKQDVTEYLLDNDYTEEQLTKWRNGEEVPEEALNLIFIFFGYYLGGCEKDKISKDLSKIENMDFENIAVTTEDDEGESHLLGFRVLKNGLPVLGMTSCLDSSFPVYFCIYWDGKSFRGYIPTYGNTFIVSEMCIMGDEYEDYLKEMGQEGSPIPDNRHLRSDEAMEIDICSRIVISD